MVTEMRPRIAATLTELFESDDRLAIVLAEISTDLFRGPRRSDPARAVNVGIMEATMVGVAAGFAMEGFHPVAHTIGPFMTERPFEQLKLDFGYQGLEGTFVSVGGSYDYGAEGGTHHAPGDVGVIATIPGMEILAPGTAAEADRLVRASYANGRASYLRASLAQNTVSFEIEPGRLEVARHASHDDAPVVVAFGPMLSRTLEAATGLDVTVAYATSVVPFDAPGLAAIAGDGHARCCPCPRAEPHRRDRRPATVPSRLRQRRGARPCQRARHRGDRGATSGDGRGVARDPAAGAVAA